MSSHKATEITLTMVLPGIREGDKNVDWREVAEKLHEQVTQLTKQLDECRPIVRIGMLTLWETPPHDLELDANGDILLWPVRK